MKSTSVNSVNSVNKYKMVCFVLTSLLIFAGLSASPACGNEVGPVKITTVTGVESHGNISDAEGGFSGETYLIFVATSHRELQKGVIGSVYYYNRHSLDEGDTATHAGGVSVIRIFGPHAVGIFGYSHTSNPGRGVTMLSPENDRDRFLGSLIYNFNPEDRGKTQYSVTATYSTVTDFGEQQVLSVKPAVKLPVSRNLDADAAYAFVYGLSENDQYANQWSANLHYRLSKKTKISLGYMLIDNVYENNPGDDDIFRLSVSQNWR